MYKYIVKFLKKDNIRFISHLDLMRVYERAFRRADMKLAYSQGFHPHPKISIAHPLSLGYSSTGEYMELELEQSIGPNEVMERLNACLPEGLVILSCKEIFEKVKAIASLVQFAEYDIKIYLDESSKDIDFEEELKQFLDLKEVIVDKKAKKGRKRIIKQVDVKPFIKNIHIVEINEAFVELKTTLRTGSEGNLNPELMMKAFFKNNDIEISFDNIFFHRTEIIFDESLDNLM